MKKTRIAGILMIAIALIALFCSIYLPADSWIMGLLGQGICLTVGRIWALVAVLLLFI